MYDILRQGRLHKLSISTQYDLFDKIVKPILLYGCEVWGFTNVELIERVHLRFCKLLLNLKKSTPNYMVYGELGAYPMNIYIKHRMVNYWTKLINGKDNKFSSILYKVIVQKYLLNEKKSKWLIFIKQILDSCGFSNLFYYNNMINKKWVSEAIKLRLLDQYKQKWSSEVFNSPKGISYRIFKEEFRFEKYLDILDKNDRILYCKFRTCNHKLPIETGRWFRIERNERKCLLCNRNDIGDEFHYIFNCPKISTHRNRYLKNELKANINILKFKYLFQSVNPITLRKLCRLIDKINKIVSPPQ